MMQPFALALAVVVAQAAAAPAGDYDAFSKILSDTQRQQISRDSRCGDAKTATDQFVATKDPHTGVAAMVSLEKCASLSRVGDWADYIDYLLTAAGAVAYEIGAIANEPKAYDRALKDLAQVRGYQAPSSVTRVVVGRDTPTNTVGSAAAGQTEMEAGLPMQNSANYKHETQHATGYNGPYGELATQVGEAAQVKLSERQAKPQTSR